MEKRCKEVSKGMDSVMHGAKDAVIDMTHVPDDLVFGLDIGTRSVGGTVG